MKGPGGSIGTQVSDSSTFLSECIFLQEHALRIAVLAFPGVPGAPHQTLGQIWHSDFSKCLAPPSARETKLRRGDQPFIKMLESSGPW